jgi:transposase-like protein
MNKGLNLVQITERFPDAESAAEYLEAIRWPAGPVCPHCGSDRVGRINVARDRRRVWKCYGCRKPFSVTVGTIFEASHIPLNKWLIAFHLLCASKKGMSALQLSRMLGVTNKTAWFMAHRIRYAMSQPPFKTKLAGVVEVDETYIGGKPRAGRIRTKKDRQMWIDSKAPVVALVQREGDVRSFHLPRVTGDNLRQVLSANIDPDSRLVTDGSTKYWTLGKAFASHESVEHRAGEYVRDDVTTNTVEGFFGLLKRGVIGSYHHVSHHHLHRYLAEFDFRWNRRKISDGDRTEAALGMAEGKRLMYKDSLRAGSPA